MATKKRIFISGHRGLVGSALVRRFQNENVELVTRTHEELDLLRQSDVEDFFRKEKIDIVLSAAAKVGGILANRDQQSEFLYENVMISFNLIRSSVTAGVEKFLYLGSSCIYPRDCTQPIKEEYILTGPLEQTNEAYAIAKIAALKYCEKLARQYKLKFYSAMPCNLFGPHDNFSELSSHVIPALMRRFHVAKVSGQSEVVVWGSGKPLREFLYVDDLAEAISVLITKYDKATTINVGSGEECTIAELAEQIKTAVNYKGQVVFDTTKPDGTPRKILDSSRIHSLGWKSKVSLQEGLQRTYQWALENKKF